MAENIDESLYLAFTPQRIEEAYFEYKLAKWDRFSGIVEPNIEIPMGADGVTFEAFEKQLSASVFMKEVTHSTRFENLISPKNLRTLIRNIGL